MTKDLLMNLPNKQFAKLFKKVVKRIKKDPLQNFVRAQGFMNFTPSAAQQVILKIIFRQKLDAEEKIALPFEEYAENDNFSLNRKTYMTEVELYKYLTGKEYSEAAALDQIINKINLVCGRRSGKTTLVAIIAVFCAITNNWKPFLHKTPFATILVMSHSREFSDEVLDTIKQFIEESPVLSRLINKQRKQTASTMNLKMPFLQEGGETIEYSQVQIKVGAASSKTTRGIAACVVICDEIAYWHTSDTMKETDAQILKAVRPALKQFGEKAMLFKLSSPGIKQGVLYEEHQRYQEDELPTSYVVFKAPTWVMNEVIPEQELIEEYLYDPEGFLVEYAAEFMDSISNFIMAASIDGAVQKGIPLNPPDDDKELRYTAALDAGFKADAFTFTLVAASENRVKQFIAKSWQGTRKDPVQAHEVAQWIQKATKDYPIDYIAADQFAFQPLFEIFAKYDLILQEYPFTTAFKKKIYYNLKKLIHSQQIDLLDVERQTKELKELVVEQSPSGSIRIGHPRGGSDDYSDSLATATFIAIEGLGSGSFSFEDNVPVLDYGIKTDREGTSFQAPSPDILVRSGHLAEDIFDNSSLYGVDPEDGQLKRWQDFNGIEEDEDEEASFGYSF